MKDIELKGYFDVASTVKVDGDIVECGVYMGESLGAITRALPGRRVWGYDSFEGFPAGNPEYDDPVALGLEGAVVGNIAAVCENVGAGARELIIRAGWFHESFVRWPLPEEIAFLSIDCDLYDSVLLSLRTFAHRVVPGGIITIDDWSAFVGARRAFYQWAHEESATPLIRTFGTGQAGWRV